MNGPAVQDALRDAIGASGMPGAVLGVALGKNTLVVSAGLANLESRVAMTPETVFHIGSTGKSWTASTAMTFVDDGLLDLDVPVRRYLPEFAVADPEVSATVTCRHLLSHSSGIDGDHIADFGRGEGALRRYVESCASLKQLHPLGETMSYCNTGYPIVARVLETLTGKVWDDLLKERLIGPLGLKRTSTLPEDAIVHRRAVGHLAPAGEPLAVAQSVFPRAAGPMGLTNCTAADLLTFARLHLDGGCTPDGSSLLTRESTLAMREPQIAVPDKFHCDAWGLGWMLFDWDGRVGFGHDGDVPGMSAFFRVIPDAGMAVCLLTNGGDAAAVIREVVGPLLAEHAGVALPTLPLPAEDPSSTLLQRFAGSYERLSSRTTLRVEGDRLVGTRTLSGPTAAMVPDPVRPVTLQLVQGSVFLVLDERGQPTEPAVFYGDDQGVPRYMHQGLRATPRVSD